MAGIGSLLWLGAAQVLVLNPEHESIVLTETIEVRVEFLGGNNQEVTLWVENFDGIGDPIPPGPPLDSGKGRATLPFSNVPLAMGPNRIHVQTDGPSAASIVVNRGVGLAPGGPQKVRFEWDEDSDETLRAIASGTLDSTPPAMLSVFVMEVKHRVVEYLEDAFRGVADVQIVAWDGPGVHTIIMLGSNRLNGFGQAKIDFGNRNEVQEALISRINLGKFRDEMGEELASKWSPMLPGDPFEIRIEDVAQAVARTCAHELGHSLGLVVHAADPADGVPEGPGTWLFGTRKGHNNNPLHTQLAWFPFRSAQGRYIMDSAEFNNVPGADERMVLLNKYRIGRTEPAVVGEPDPERIPMQFNPVSRAYLGLILPRP